MNIKYITSCVRSDMTAPMILFVVITKKNDERLLFEDVHRYVHIEISSK